jgi:sugar/nucleoside kinase (ribokinase family)
MCLHQATGQEPSGLIPMAGKSGSYTLSLAPHDRDRTLLYFPGANDAFGEESVRDEDLRDCAVVHCAYPTVLRSFLLDDGLSLRRIFERAHALGAITSLDLTVPDRQALSGQIDWSRWLDNVLPETDVFVPSIAEMHFILAHDGLRGAAKGAHSALTIDSVQAVCEAVVNYGVQVAGVKMGRQGLYLKRSRELRGGVLKYTSLAADRVTEFTQPAFRVQVHAAGTTGAGDCAYAGLLYALITGCTLQQCAAFAAACGAACVMSQPGPAVLPSTDEIVAQFMLNRFG